ncbi:MAG: hypothetical protein ACO1O3_14175 [Sphingobium sp.]|jgi:hypothetical protein
MPSEFELREREPAARDDNDPVLSLRDALRATYEVRRDTFITGDLPVLLTRLSRLQPVESGGDTNAGP